MSTKKKKIVQVSVKWKLVKKDTPKGYKVSYSMYWGDGQWKRDITAIVYKTKEDAQKYADQLNRSHRFRNARVRKA